MENGFIQTVMKASRIFDGKISLIDHIFTNTKNPSIISGSIVCDISDHFITFISPPLIKQQIKKKPVVTRDMSLQKMTNFREALQTLTWRNVTQSQNVNESYEIFWNDFITLHDLHFPEKTVPFSRNTHKINPFMTKGLLISRKNKNILHKTAVKERSVLAVARFRQYRNIYSSLIRQSKKLYYHSHLSKNRKNPKKIWQLLKEVSVGSKSQDKIEKITVQGKSTDDPKEMAEHFNKFLLKLAKKYQTLCSQQKS